MALLDRLKKRNKNPVVDEDATRHHADALDYFEDEQKAFTLHCPECAIEQKHVKLVKTKGELLECPECHYLHETRRM